MDTYLRKQGQETKYSQPCGNLKVSRTLEVFSLYQRLHGLCLCYIQLLLQGQYWGIEAPTTRKYWVLWKSVEGAPNLTLMKPFFK